MYLNTEQDGFKIVLTVPILEKMGANPMPLL